MVTDLSTLVVTVLQEVAVAIFQETKIQKYMLQAQQDYG
jgi:hypothetical protein